MFLTTEEIKAYTGYVRPSDQIKYLAVQGVPCDIDKFKRPKVLRNYIEKRLGFNDKSTITKKEPQVRFTQPLKTKNH